MSDETYTLEAGLPGFQQRFFGRLRNGAFKFPIVLLATFLTYFTARQFLWIYDVNPVMDFAFYVSLFAIYGLIAACGAQQKLAAIFNSFANFLTDRGAFRSSLAAERPKFALIRILFGLLMTERAFWIVYFLYPADWHDGTILFFAFANLAFALCVVVGFCAQISLAYFLVVAWQMGDVVMSTSTLGNDIASMLTVLLIFANAGASLSLDSIVIRRGGILGRAVSFFYYKSGTAPDNTLQVVKFLVLLAYWCMCLYSLMRHLGEASWMSGIAGPDLLTSNFMSRYSVAFQRFFELGPWAVMLGRISLWCMLPWYLLVVPFVMIGGLARTYVIAWGCLFFFLSLFVLQLGWLGHFEFLFFAALFWEKRFIGSPGRLQVAYDDKCNLCDRTVTLVKWADVFGRVTLRPLSQNTTWLEGHGISYSDAMQDLYGVEETKTINVSSGYDLYIVLCRNLLLLALFYPILLIGKWTGIGPAIYRRIADRRTKLFGVCQIPTAKPDHLSTARSIPFRRSILAWDPVIPMGCHVIVLAAFYLALTPAPSIKWDGVPVPDALGKFVAVASHFYGMEPIVVFNRVDLKMSENWFTISAVDKSGHETLLPVFTEKGTRLPMHMSDRIYYGATVPIRRDMIDKPDCDFDLYRFYIDRLATTYTASNANGVSFIYRQFHQGLPNDKDLLNGHFITPASKSVCTKPFSPLPLSPPDDT